ncbi:unnamed protein product [Cuscuta epithymum]|uniref:Pre-mRNA-processing protein 40A n=1 Tax=Cuscuta epithymum TaxID=186058 RepID=A0AAV0C353_9ASTE|nr:unnamed protein product [Cuscuta epithymum]
MTPHGYGSYPMQFQPGAHVQQGQPFAMGPGQNQGMQYSQQMQQFPPRPGQPSHMPSSQPIQMPNMQPGGPISSSSLQHQQMIHSANNHMPGLQFSPSPFGQTNSGMNMSSQMNTPLFAAGGQHWLPPGNHSAPMQHTIQPSSGFTPSVAGASAQNSTEQSTSDWQEYEVSGRRYYYNKISKQSSWEKPLELMTPLERAEALTGWKEFTTENGKKYYYHKEKKESKWEIPEELKLARDQAEKAAAQGQYSDAGLTSKVAISATGTSSEQQFTAVTPVSSSPSTISGVPLSPAPITPIASVNAPSVAVSGSPAPAAALHSAITGSVNVSSPAAAPGSNTDAIFLASSNQTPPSSMEKISTKVVATLGASSVQDIEQVSKSADATNLEEKASDEEPLVYATKQEAKIAFKALLESANVGSDWTWDQTVRAIANDKRYGALKTHGERKQAFNEYLMQRKKLEAEEKRLRQRKAKEEFTKMLEESKDLTSSTRWSKAVTMFEDDERFKAVEREADREELFKIYTLDLQKKEKAKAQEDYRRNRLEYRQFLETCGFIRVDTQWRKVQDLLEDDERCSRLEKYDRLEVFQEYIRDLEREEEEQRKTQKEYLRRAERKNRDAFRNMMEDHIAAGTLTAKTEWHDYCPMVKECVAYQAVASNTSGSTPRDLFEDTVEELENKYYEDKARVKNVLKSEKITFSSSWSFEDFKDSILESIGTPPISDVNLQLIFDDLMERAKEKDEKEAKKRHRLAKDFMEMLSTFDEITVSSSWDECKELVEDSSEYKAIGEETTLREIFEEHVAHMQEKAKEKERRREEEKAKKDKEKEEKEKKKDKERKEKDREKEDREREKEKGRERWRKDDADSESADFIEYDHKEDKKRDKDKERKHRKRHHSSQDDVTSDKDEREETKRSRRHGGDRKKSRRHSPESDSESRHKRHRKERSDGSRRNSGGHEELEDGELGEDGEIH